jgi:hypothetical protein
LSRQLAVDGSAGPVVRPCNVSVLANRNHWLNRKGHSWLALANRFVLGVMRDVGGAMEQLSNTMTAISSDDAAVVFLGMLLDNVAKLSDQNSRFHRLNRLFQAFTSRLNNTNCVGVTLGSVTNVVGLVQIRVESPMVKRDVKVENIAVE